MFKRKNILWALAVIFIGTTLFFVGLKTGERLVEPIIIEGVSNTSTEKPADVDFGAFWKVWKLVNDRYLHNNDAKNQDKVYGAITGLVHSLGDPYSEYFKPQESKKFQDDIRGNFGGIGAEIGIRRDRLTIISPLQDSPAMRAGLKPSDYIAKINASSTDGLQLDEAVSIIRGPVGSVVNLTIFRKDSETPQEIKVTRATINLPTLDFAMIGDIAHIQLHSFNGSALSLFEEAANKAQTKGMKGMIMDLRNDPGGALDVAINISEWFLPKNTLVVSEEGVDGVREDLRTRRDGPFKNLPIVVLVNSGSASASEILAGALRDNRKIKLVGEKTFGKGTVQELISLDDGSSVKLTIAHWVMPSGKILDHDGLVPDVEVKPLDDSKDTEQSKDPQLEKALELLLDQIHPGS